MSIHDEWWPEKTLTGALQKAIEQTKEMNRKVFRLRMYVNRPPYPLNKLVDAPAIRSPPYLPSFQPPAALEASYYVYYDNTNLVWLHTEKADVEIHQNSLHMVAKWNAVQRGWEFLNPLKKVHKPLEWKDVPGEFHADISDSDEDEPELLSALEAHNQVTAYRNLRDKRKKVLDTVIPRWAELIREAAKANEDGYSKYKDSVDFEFGFANYTTMLEQARAGNYWPPFYPRSKASKEQIIALIDKGTNEWKVTTVAKIGGKNVVVPVETEALGRVFEQRAAAMRTILVELRACLLTIKRRVDAYTPRAMTKSYGVPAKMERLMSPTDEVELTECLATFMHQTTAMFMPHIYKTPELEAWDVENVYMKMLLLHLQSSSFAVTERPVIENAVRALMQEARGQDARLPYFQGVNATPFGGKLRAHEWPHPYSGTMYHPSENNTGPAVKLAQRKWPDVGGLNAFLGA